MRCWVLTMYLRRLIFLSVSDCRSPAAEAVVEDDLAFSFSTSSFRARKESSAARDTRAENSTVCCPSSAAIGDGRWIGLPYAFLREIYDKGDMEARVSSFGQTQRRRERGPKLFFSLLFSC